MQELNAVHDHRFDPLYSSSSASPNASNEAHTNFLQSEIVNA